MVIEGKPWVISSALRARALGKSGAFGPRKDKEPPEKMTGAQLVMEDGLVMDATQKGEDHMNFCPSTDLSKYRGGDLWNRHEPAIPCCGGTPRESRVE